MPNVVNECTSAEPDTDVWEYTYDNNRRLTAIVDPTVEAPTDIVETFD